jgi:hypothetical protein
MIDSRNAVPPLAALMSMIAAAVADAQIHFKSVISYYKLYRNTH